MQAEKCINLYKSINDMIFRKDYTRALELYTELSMIVQYDLKLKYDKIYCLFELNDWYGIISETTQLIKVIGISNAR